VDKAIVPECFADTLLAEMLVPTATGYNHQHSCSKVERLMKHGALRDKFAVGIIDNDRNSIGYLDEFETIDEVAGRLILWKHKAKPHFIIQICPALEGWILDVCAKTGIQLKAANLDTLDKLKNETKSESSLKNKKLRRLFEEIKSKQEHVPVRKLTKWITLLRDKNYNVDLNELKNA
jgi:hypothetical protein